MSVLPEVNVLQEVNVYPTVKVDIDLAVFEHLKEISDNLHSLLNVQMSEGELLTRIANNFFDKTGYIALIALDKKLRFSVEELEALSKLSLDEFTIFEQLCINSRDNIIIHGNVKLIRSELAMCGKLYTINGESSIVDELWMEMDNQFRRLYRDLRLRRGVKKLVMKAAMIAMIFE